MSVNLNTIQLAWCAPTPQGIVPQLPRTATPEPLHRRSRSEQAERAGFNQADSRSMAAIPLFFCDSGAMSGTFQDTPDLNVMIQIENMTIPSATTMARDRTGTCHVDPRLSRRCMKSRSCRAA